jgi:hypothetical protein
VNTQTQEASNRDGWSAWARGPSADERAPRLRLLYHPDIDRIGALSLPGAIASRWFTLGRHDPPFGGLGGATLPIDDPKVSREQLRVRWIADALRFEVEPIPGARRSLGLVDLDGDPEAGPVASPITSSSASSSPASARPTPAASGSSARAKSSGRSATRSSRSRSSAAPRW